MIDRNWVSPSELSATRRNIDTQLLPRFVSSKSNWVDVLSTLSIHFSRSSWPLPSRFVSSMPSAVRFSPPLRENDTSGVSDQTSCVVTFTSTTPSS